MSTKAEHDKIVGADSLISEIFASVRRYGLYDTFIKAIRYIKNNDDFFDKTYHTDTGRIEPLWKLRISSSNNQFGRRYQAIDESELLGAFRYLCLDPEKFAFIDLGCGKGRPPDRVQVWF